MPVFNTDITSIFNNPKSATPIALAALPLLLSLRHLLLHPARPSVIPHTSERVLILGATSGIGREIALQYAARGAKVCVVGRRQALLDEVVEECGGGERCVGVRGDFGDVGDMVRVRGIVEGGACLSADYCYFI